MGEPGLGKSRLFYEFKLLSLSGCLVLEAYSVSHGKATAYLPVIELLKSYFRIESQDDDRKRREKVAGKVVILDRTLEETYRISTPYSALKNSPHPYSKWTRRFGDDGRLRRSRSCSYARVSTNRWC